MAVTVKIETLARNARQCGWSVSIDRVARRATITRPDNHDEYNVVCSATFDAERNVIATEEVRTKRQYGPNSYLIFSDLRWTTYNMMS